MPFFSFFLIFGLFWGYKRTKHTSDLEGGSTTRLALAIFFAVCAGVTTYALTASNVVAPSAAGQGAGSIVGYTISGVTYTLDLTSPQQVTQVRFTLNAPPASAATVSAKVGTASYAGCALATSTASTSTWTCNLAGVNASTSASLRVVAAQ